MSTSVLCSRKIYKTAVDQNSLIQCASLNKSDSQTFATGDENGCIKLWEIGHNECKQAFESNLAITCVAFNYDQSKINSNDNNVLVSGNIGGGIKLYDLNENKLVRNYIGHRSEITDINFFNFSNGNCLILSSSTDSNVKLWDTRSKTSIHTFKGHTNTVNCIDFSPDGHWIVSSDCIGHTKLWDIYTSKCIHEFHDKLPINHVLFHPDELVLATAVGKVVRFWDLETMKHIIRTSKVTTYINKIFFPIINKKNDDDDANEEEEEQFIISASNQSLRIWRWDPQPVYCSNNISVHWNNKIVDINQIKGYNDLICLEIDKNKVIVWHTDLGKIYQNNNKNNNHDTANIKQNDTQQKINELYKPKVIINNIQQNDELKDNENDVYDDEFEEYEEIEDEDIPFDIEMNTKTPTPTPTHVSNINDDNINVPKALQNMPKEMWTKSFISAAEIVRKQRSKKCKQKFIQKPVKKSSIISNKENGKHKNHIFACNKELKRSPIKHDEGDKDKTTSNDMFTSPTNTNLKLAQFIPKHLVDYDERELIKIKRSMMTEHIPILKMLSTRLRYLRQLKSFWKKKKYDEFVELLKNIQNDDVDNKNNVLFISFIESITNNILKKSFSFKFCYLLLSIIKFKKIDIHNENTIIIILEFFNNFLVMFSSLMIDTLKTDTTNNKNLNLIHRKQYSKHCYDLFSTDISLFLSEINTQKDNVDKSIKVNELHNQCILLIQQLN